MAIIATGQISIVDLSDGKSLSCYITANLPKTQILDPNPGGGINPDWAGATPLKLTPVVFANQTALALNAVGLSLMWKRKEGAGAETALTTGETVSNGILTISANKLSSITSGLLTYLCYVTYTDPETSIPVNVVADITFSQIKTAVNAATAWISGQQLFKYTSAGVVSPMQIELTANLTNVTLSKWQYKDSAGEWQDYPTTSDNASISAGTLIVKPTHNIFVDEGATLRIVTSNDAISDQPYLVELQMNHYVELTSCTLDANSVTYDSVYCKGSYVYLYNCGLYNALQGLEVYMGQAYVKNCMGSCSWSMICYAGYIIASGTVPAGSRGTGENGQLFATSVTIDYGTAIPTVTPDETTIQYATTTKSWRGSWRSDTVDVIQGVYSDTGYSSSLNWHRGCMWFAWLQDVLSGCTVKNATLTLHRKTGSGSSAAKTVYLCAITNTSASGTPSIAYNYGALGTIGRDKQVTFSIPTDAVQGLADGTYGGLCLYETPYNFGTSTYSNCYMRMSGTDTDLEPYLEVVYSGSTAVG